MYGTQTRTLHRRNDDVSPDHRQYLISVNVCFRPLGLFSKFDDRVNLVVMRAVDDAFEVLIRKNERPAKTIRERHPELQRRLQDAPSTKIITQRQVVRVAHIVLEGRPTSPLFFDDIWW